MTFQNTLQLGQGVYTIPQMAAVLGLPYAKVQRWLSKYWDGKLGKHYEQRYSWTVAGSKSPAVSFQTLVEFYVMMVLAEQGVPTQEVLKAHQFLSEKFHTQWPFAQQQVVEQLKTDGSKLYLCDGETILLANGSQQLTLHLIKLFFKKLEFNEAHTACRLWPLGKKRQVICDPRHRFGAPVLAHTNVQTEAVYQMHLAGETPAMIGLLYEVEENAVQDAIAFHEAMKQAA